MLFDAWKIWCSDILFLHIKTSIVELTHRLCWRLMVRILAWRPVHWGRSHRIRHRATCICIHFPSILYFLVTLVYLRVNLHRAWALLLPTMLQLYLCVHCFIISLSILIGIWHISGDSITRWTLMVLNIRAHFGNARKMTWRYGLRFFHSVIRLHIIKFVNYYLSCVMCFMSVETLVSNFEIFEAFRVCTISTGSMSQMLFR